MPRLDMSYCSHRCHRSKNDEPTLIITGQRDVLEDSAVRKGWVYTASMRKRWSDKKDGCCPSIQVSKISARAEGGTVSCMGAEFFK